MDSCLGDKYRGFHKREHRRAVNAATPSEAKALRDRYLAQSWTRKSCVLCGRPTIQLHHAAYRDRHQHLHLVPMCDHHHREFSVVIWPQLKPWLNRTEATLLYVTHGERLHRMPAPETPAQTKLF